MSDVSILFSKPDLFINFDKWGNGENCLFVTGMWGAGKSTVGRNYAKTHGATHFIQDWLGWADVYDCEWSNFFGKRFIKLYPGIAHCYGTAKWRDRNILSREDSLAYRKKWDKMVLEYIAEHPDKLFVYEGSDLFEPEYSDIKIMNGKPLIIKRTSCLKCFIRLHWRDNGNIWTLPRKYKEIWRKYYLGARVRLSEFIKNMDK